MPDDEPTPIELSRMQSGYRHYAVDPATYSQLAAGVDQIRGYPHALTIRGLPSADELPVATDGSGRVLYKIDTWRFGSADDQMLGPAIDAGLVEELTADAYAALFPEPEMQP